MAKSQTVRQQKALVTGATGFLGKYVIHELKASGYDVVETSKSLGYDLRSESEALTCAWLAKPDVIVHLARIPMPMDAHAAVFRDTMSMGLNILQVAAIARAKVLLVTPPMEAEEGQDPPWGESGAKKALISALGAYRNQYGLDCRAITFSELYGPFARSQDGFLDVATLVNTFLLARVKGEKVVVLPGDGSQERQPLCVNDAAKAVLLACNSMPFEETLEFPGSDLIAEKDLVEAVAKACAFEGSVEWSDKELTFPPATLAVPEAGEEGGEKEEAPLGWTAATSLEKGLAAVVALRMQEVVPITEARPA